MIVSKRSGSFMKKVFIILLALVLSWQSYAGINAAETEGIYVLILKALSKDKNPEAQKVVIAKSFQLLESKANDLKLGNPKYFAPWEPAAKRVDWQARDYILSANKPLTINELAKGLGMKPKDVQGMIDKDQANKNRKVFFKMTGMDDGKIWVSSAKMPPNKAPSASAKLVPSGNATIIVNTVHKWSATEMLKGQQLLKELLHSKPQPKL
jgi:hypothetical protein